MLKKLNNDQRWTLGMLVVISLAIIVFDIEVDIDSAN